MTKLIWDKLADARKMGHRLTTFATSISAHHQFSNAEILLFL